MLQSYHEEGAVHELTLGDSAGNQRAWIDMPPFFCPEKPRPDNFHICKAQEPQSTACD